MNVQFKLFIGFMVILVIGVIIAGFYLAGSPQQARMERFDQTRIQNLESIANNIYSYSLKEIDPTKRHVPQNLKVFEERTQMYHFGSLNDPETNQPYEYRVLNVNTYELCATFSTSNREKVKGNDYYSQQETFWVHDPGRTCFQRQLDQLY